jgi:hypothetical protein
MSFCYDDHKRTNKYHDVPNTGTVSETNFTIMNHTETSVTTSHDAPKELTVNKHGQNIFPPVCTVYFRQ